jgi:hypothetical protein
VGIEIILTDNAFGDNAPTLGRIFDPGVPVLVAAALGANPPGLPPEDRTIPSPTPDRSVDAVPVTGTSPLTPLSPADSSPTNPDPSPSLASTTSDNTISTMLTSDSSGGAGSTPLQQQLVQQARAALMGWAADQGLVRLTADGTTATSAEATPTDPTNPEGSSANTQPPGVNTNPLLPLTNLGPNLLEALALGAAGLYFTQALGRQSLEQVARSWWSRLFPSQKRWLAAAGMHQQILAVFVMATGGEPGKLVAARVLADAIEILAEQPLRLDRAAKQAAPAWSALDLGKAVECLAQALEGQDLPRFELLLLDPALQLERHHLEGLAAEHTLLRHRQLHPALLDLASGDQALLRQWLNQPSHTDLNGSAGCRRVMAQLADLQSHWAEYMVQEHANVAGVLELSIAISNLQPLYAVI